MCHFTWKQTDPEYSLIWVVNAYVLGSFKCSPKSLINYIQDKSPPTTWTPETYWCHAADLIQSQPQEFLVAALGHQPEGRLLQAVWTLEHQASDVSDTLKGDEGVPDEPGTGAEGGGEGGR